MKNGCPILLTRINFPMNTTNIIRWYGLAIRIFSNWMDLPVQKVVLLGSFNNWNDNELFMTKPAVAGNWHTRWARKLWIPFEDRRAATEDSSPKETFHWWSIPISPSVLKDLIRHILFVLLGTSITGTLIKNAQGRDEWIFMHLNKGKHLYKFVVDGKWMLDPANKIMGTKWIQQLVILLLWFEKE